MTDPTEWSNAPSEPLAATKNRSGDRVDDSVWSPGTAVRLRITGVVQGVGFRPFVFRLATELGLVGRVWNDVRGVVIEVAGEPEAIDRFREQVAAQAPTLARIDRIRLEPIDDAAFSRFEIVDSAFQNGPRTLIPPDSAVCSDCLVELFDPTDRRFGHPFITCTNCGPRVSIIAELPYDRAHTTMAPFEMCASCRAEYEDPLDRRYHAQPIGCHGCGPTIVFGSRIDDALPDDALDRAAADIEAGGIVAIKGIGGYHLVCDATNHHAIGELRRRKARPDKPFAVMVADVSAADDLAVLDAFEVEALTGPAAPIVLARRRADSNLSNLTAPGSPLIGIMVAYTPVHHLLIRRLGRPLVVTSANRSGTPLAYRRSDIAALHQLYDAVLDHDREIRVPVDDSVVRCVGDTTIPLRRARGFAPMPFGLPESSTGVLAVGGELKNTFCLSRHGRAWVSPHIGDMENLETLRAFESMLDEFCSMYEVSPRVVAVDAHPRYVSSRWARRRFAHDPTVELVEVQHHHAHVAAVIAEHAIDPGERVLGFAFDGTGYGSDGTVWGGEVLIATAAEFERVGHLRSVSLPGGDTAVANPNRAALAHLHAGGIAWTDDLASLEPLSAGERILLAQQLDRQVNCIPTTSMGRLFDAVASLLGLRHRISYEAQAAIELEIAAERGRRNGRPPYRFDIEGGVMCPTDILRSIVDDVRSGRSTDDIAFWFHVAVADAVETLAHDICADSALDTIVLSGGVFQNAVLQRLCMDRLGDYRTFTHRAVPPNDGGLSLGQALVATQSRFGTRGSSTTPGWRSFPT